MNWVYAIPTLERNIISIENLGLRKDRVHIFVNTREEKQSLQCKVALKGCNIIATGIRGIAANRNAILDYFRKGEQIVMVDDDVIGLFLFLNGNLERCRDLEEFIKHAFHVTYHNSTKLWGVYPIKNQFFMSNSIAPDGFCISTFSGIINSDLRFDETMGLKEDYDFTLQHIMRYKKVVRFNNYCVEAKHYSNKGGCQNYRTDDMERDAVGTLIAKYPNLVQLNPKRPNEVLIRTRKVK